MFLEVHVFQKIAILRKAVSGGRCILQKLPFSKSLFSEIRHVLTKVCHTMPNLLCKSLIKSKCVLRDLKISEISNTDALWF